MYTSPAILLKEIILVDDASVDGKNISIFSLYFFCKFKTLGLQLNWLKEALSLPPLTCVMVF